MPKGKHKGTVKICPKCRKKVELKGAKFCPFCGNDLRTESEILVEKVDKLKDLFIFLPETARDEFIQVLREVELTLLKEDK